jgi:hypothetical protein
MKKYFTDREYAAIIAKIMAMDLLVHAFNDEKWIAVWFMGGVPDGLESREDYETTYHNDLNVKHKDGSSPIF